MASILKVDTLQKPDGSTPTAADLGLNISGNIVSSKTVMSDAPATTVAADVTALLDTFTFETKYENSRILISYHSGQIQLNSTNSDANPRMWWSVDSTSSVGNLDLYIDHDHSWYRANDAAGSDKRLFITGQALSVPVAKGNHTIRCTVGAYGDQLTYNFQTGRRRVMVTFQEIAQ